MPSAKFDDAIKLYLYWNGEIAFPLGEGRSGNLEARPNFSAKCVNFPVPGSDFTILSDL